MPGLFVTGTDTGAGKTVVAAAILAALRAQGEAVRAFKPVITGLDEPPGSWPHDHEVLARAAGSSPEEVALVRYGPAVSPHLAAELADRLLDPAELVRDILAAGDDGALLIVEGAGGLLVPLRGDYDMRSLARDLGLGVVIAARPKSSIWSGKCSLPQAKRRTRSRPTTPTTFPPASSATRASRSTATTPPPGRPRSTPPPPRARHPRNRRPGRR